MFYILVFLFVFSLKLIKLIWKEVKWLYHLASFWLLRLKQTFLLPGSLYSSNSSLDFCTFWWIQSTTKYLVWWGSRTFSVFYLLCIFLISRLITQVCFLVSQEKTQDLLIRQINLITFLIRWIFKFKIVSKFRLYN